MNTYSAKNFPDTEGKATEALAKDEIIDIVYYSIPYTLKNKKIGQGFNYVDSSIKEMTDFFATRVEIMNPTKIRKNILLLPRNPRGNKVLRKVKEKIPTYV